RVRWHGRASRMNAIKAQCKKLKVDEAAGAYQIEGTALEAVFAKSSGAVSQLVYQGQEVITGGLLPNFVRPATENDRRGWKPDRKLKYWYGDTKLTDMSLRQEGAEVHIESASTLSGDSAQVTVRYTVKPQGIVSVSYDLQVKQGLPNIPKVGYQMGIHSSFES